jgi:DNA polymerase V
VKLTLHAAETARSLSLQFADAGVRAGFPSPAQDFMGEPIDFNRDMIKNPDSTFYAKVSGDSMQDEGIASGDILVIDRSREGKNGALAVCAVDGEFTLKRIRTQGSRLFLMPANTDYKPLEITEANNFIVWGVVVYIIKKP